MNHRDRLVFIDVETTGLNQAKGARIIEIGAIAMAEGRVTDEFQRLVRVNFPIPRHVSQIHGITNDMLIGQPTPEQTYPEFKDFVADSLLVAHNARFDMGFLRAEFSRLKQQITNKSVCTLEMSRRRYPRLPNHKLNTVYNYLLGGTGENTRNTKGMGVPFRLQRHRALDDARMVAEIWLAMGGK